MPSENSLRNLKPFQPGQSGNPGGRRKRVLSDRYAELMESPLPEELRKPLGLAPGCLWGDAIALVSARTALKSTEVGVAQRREIADRIEGKSPQRFELATDGAFEIVVSFEAPIATGEKKVIDLTDTPSLPAGKNEGPE